MVHIAGHATIAQCEEQLREIVAADVEEPLRLPTRARYLATGAEIALTQLIVTWAQRVRVPHLRTFAESGEDEQVVNLTRRLYGLAATLCAKTVSGVRNELDLTNAFKASALDRLKVLQSDKPKTGYRGSSIEIVCADHLGRGAPYLLYQPSRGSDSALRSRSNFQLLAAWLVRNTLPKSYSQNFGSDDAQALGSMLYEIFRNTDDHALTDREGNRLGLSIRALKAAHLSPRPEDLARMVAEYAPLASYCRHLQPAPGRGQIHLFELSILDSGPGFAQSWTGKALSDLSEAEEERAVHECFDTGSTKPRAHAGEGLLHVIRLLRREGGFLRLRTGRLSLFADFSGRGGGDEELNLTKWVPEDDTPLAAVAGTLITIIVPIRSSQ